MSSSSFRRATLALILAATSGSASANVTFYDAFKTADYAQVSEDAPDNAYNYRFDARIFTNTDNDAITGTITPPPPTAQLPLTPQGTQLTAYRDQPYSSFTALDATYPQGTYTYAITSGNLAGATATLPMGPSIYPDAVPYFTSGSYTAIQNVVAGQDLTLTFNSCSFPAGANYSLTFFDVFDYTANQFIYDAYGDNGGYLSDTIPGNLILPHHQLGFVVDFSNRYESYGDFPGSTVIAGFDISDKVDTVSTPSWGLIPGDANDDQVVDADDYALIDRGFQAHLTGWANGDFNLDGVVDSADYLLIDETYAEEHGLSPSLLAQRESQFGPSYIAQLEAAVPEPSNLLGVALLVMLLSTYRPRYYDKKAQDFT